MWLGASPPVVVPGTIRRLYPSWDLLGRPALPDPLAAAAVVHATNPAAVPPVRHGQRLVVTVHDLAFERFPELFPRNWRWLYRAGLRAAAKRADAILVPSKSTADDVADRTDIDPAACPRDTACPVARRIEQRSGRRARSARRVVALRAVGRHDRTTKEPDASGSGVSAGCSGRPACPGLAGAPGWQAEEAEAELARPGPGTIVPTGYVTDEQLDTLYRGADAFVYPSLYEGFGLPVRRGDDARHPDHHIQ